VKEKSFNPYPLIMIDLNLIPYDKSSILLENRLELFFQELAVIFDKKVTDFYGTPYCLNLQKYLFSRYVSTREVSHEITKYVIENCYNQQFFKWNVDVSYLQTEKQTDILYIKFNIESDGEKYTNQFLIGSK
jgi:hypothetical protein